MRCVLCKRHDPIKGPSISGFHEKILSPDKMENSECLNVPMREYYMDPQKNNTLN